MSNSPSISSKKGIDKNVKGQEWQELVVNLKNDRAVFPGEDVTKILTSIGNIIRYGLYLLSLL